MEINITLVLCVTLDLILLVWRLASTVITRGRGLLVTRGRRLDLGGELTIELASAR